MLASCPGILAQAQRQNSKGGAEKLEDRLTSTQQRILAQQHYPAYLLVDGIVHVLVQKILQRLKQYAIEVALPYSGIV